MKLTRALILILLFLAAQPTAWPQGRIAFINYYGTGGVVVNAPVTDVSGHRIVGPGPYVADLFWSPDLNAPLDSLAPAGFNAGFASFAGGGYFDGGEGILSGVAGGQTILAQVRVWDTRFGSTYAQARDTGGEFGFSNPIQLTPSLPLISPTPLLGLQGFQLQLIPEPSSLALAVVAGSIFLLRFRKHPARTKMSPEP